MVGITSYGAYIPLYRLPLIEIAKAWNVPPRGKGERSVANYDEDSLSMSVGASVHALSGMDRSMIDGFYFATTTSPYAEKMVSTIGAAALDFGHETRTLDFTNSLRSGTGAIIAALDAVKAGTLKNVLVAAGDTRAAQTQGDMEQTFGDGAAAVVIGDTDVAAEIVDTLSISDEIMDVWRPSSETYVRAWEERFGFTVSYSKLMPKAAGMLLEKNCLAPQDLAQVVITAPTIRRHKGMGKTLGLNPEQCKDLILPSVGNTGTALPLMMIVQALETSKAGDNIMVLSYSNGCDAILLKVTENIEKLRDRIGIKHQIESKRKLPSYQKFLRFKELVPVAPVPRPDRTPVAAVTLWRHRKDYLALYGSKCTECGAQQYPAQRVCVKCHTKDKREMVGLSDKKLSVFTYTQDNLAASVDPPVIVGVVEFEGGGRAAFDITDRDPQEVKVGMEVEFTFRRLFFNRGIHNYYWKIRPLR